MTIWAKMGWWGHKAIKKPYDFISLEINAPIDNSKNCFLSNDTAMYKIFTVGVQLTFTCSKSTIEAPEKVRNMFEVNNIYKHQKDVTGVVLVFLQLNLNIFFPFVSVSITNFEQVNISWVI